MKKIILNFSLVLTFLSIQSCAFAEKQPDTEKHQGGPPSVEEIFKQMDANKDGKLSIDEVKGPIKNDFSKIDIDGDSFITKEELQKTPKPDRNRPPQGQGKK